MDASIVRSRVRCSNLRLIIFLSSASSDATKHPNPELSIFLPECTLGAPTSPNSRSHKFHIEGKKGFGGDLGQKNGLFSSEVNFTFRARSHDEMLEWWNDCKQLSKVYRT